MLEGRVRGSQVSILFANGDSRMKGQWYKGLSELREYR